MQRLIIDELLRSQISRKRKNMTSKITKTIGGHFEINVTGNILVPGNRVAAGEGNDYDTGIIDSIDGDMAIIRWHSNIVTSLNLTGDLKIIL